MWSQPILNLLGFFLVWRQHCECQYQLCLVSCSYFKPVLSLCTDTIKQIKCVYVCMCTLSLVVVDWCRTDADAVDRYRRHCMSAVLTGTRRRWTRSCTEPCLWQPLFTDSGSYKSTSDADCRRRSYAAPLTKLLVGQRRRRPAEMLMLTAMG